MKDDFVIPTKLSPDASLTYVKDLCSMEIVPEALRTVVSTYFRERNQKLDIEIKRLVDQERNHQETYLSDMLSAYESLMSDIQTAFTGSKQLSSPINGTYACNTVTPSISYWQECNPGKYAAIRQVVRQLEEQGWKPTVDISRYDYNDETDYSGGNTLTVSCYFG